MIKSLEFHQRSGYKNFKCSTPHEAIEYLPSFVWFSVFGKKMDNHKSVDTENAKAFCRKVLLNDQR